MYFRVFFGDYLIGLELMINILWLVCSLNYIVIVFFRDFEVVGYFLLVVLNLLLSCCVVVRYISIKVVGEFVEWIEKYLDYFGMYILYMVWVLFVFGF